MNDMATTEPAVTWARARWQAAEAELYPALMTDPAAYRRTLDALAAVVDALRRRCSTVADLVALPEPAPEIVAAAREVGLPAPLLMGAAAAMLAREFDAERIVRERRAAVAEAEARGRAWAVLEGPADPAELTAGRSTVLHIASGTALTAAVTPWQGAHPYTLDATTRQGETQTQVYSDRDEWLAGHRRRREALEAGGQREVER